MIRFLSSLLCGVLPAVVIVLLVHGALNREAASARDRQPSMPRSSPSTRPAAPPRHPNVLAAWSEAQDTDLKRVELLQDLGAADVLQILENLDRVEGKNFVFQRHRQLAFDRLADCDRSAALEYAQGLPTEEDRTFILGYLAGRWAHEDPDSCWEWHEELNADLSDRHAHTRLFRAIVSERFHLPPVEREVATAWKLLEERPDEVAGSLTAAWNMWPLTNQARETGNWRETTQRIASMPEVGVGGLWPIMQQWLDHDFEGATTWVGSLPEGEERRNIVGAMTWDPNKVPLEGEYDRSRLCDWLSEQEWPELRSAFSHWAGNQLVESGRWLSEQNGNTEALNRTREAYAELIAEHDVEAAMAWAMSLPENRQTPTIRDICREWHEEEPWAARAWAKEKLGWTETECDRWLN